MRSFVLGIACLCLAGCAAASAGLKVDEFELAEYRAVVALSAADLEKPDGPAPNKPLRKDCKVCNGTGKVRSGDGLHIFDCTACIPPLVALNEEIFEGSVPPANYSEIPKGSLAGDEVAFGEDEPRTLKTQVLCPCECEKTGLCHCPTCSCATTRTRVAYLYCTDPCPGCDAAKEAIKTAAAAGTLPSDLRVEVRCGAGVPGWVKVFPTFHFQFADRWYQTTKADVFLRECNGRKVTAATFPESAGTVYFGTCGPAGCSGGSYFSGGYSSGVFYGGGGCSSGSCGSWGGGFSRPYFGGGGFRGGFSGGGCSSCR